MRSRLKSVEEIVSFETNLDEKFASITFPEGFDIEAKLNELAELNHKMSEWKKIDE